MRTSMLLMLTLATACGGTPKPVADHATTTATTVATATLSGAVHMSGAACAQPKPGCEGPAAGYEVIVFAKDGTTVVAKTKTDAEGHYTVMVPGGDYTIITQAGTTRAETKRNDVTVAASAAATLDLSVDNGVR